MRKNFKTKPDQPKNPGKILHQIGIGLNLLHLIVHSPVDIVVVLEPETNKDHISFYK